MNFGEIFSYFLRYFSEKGRILPGVTEDLDILFIPGVLARCVEWHEIETLGRPVSPPIGCGFPYKVWHVSLHAGYFLKSSFWYFPSECTTSNRNLQFGQQGPRLPLGCVYSVVRKGGESGAEGTGVRG
jgi:hypothetical protein